MAHDVFVSHSSKDKLTADAVCAVLESQGIRCWVAPRDIIPGREWGASIVEAIRGAKVMVLIFSAHANGSPQINKEVERAVNKGIPVIPMRIEDIVPTESLEYFLSSNHWLDAFSPPLEKHLQYLTQVVRQIIGGPATEILPTPTAERELREKAEEKRQADEAAKLAEENRKKVEASEAREKARRADEEQARLEIEKRKAVDAEAARRSEAKRQADEAAQIAPPAGEKLARPKAPARLSMFIRKFRPSVPQIVWLSAVALVLTILGRLNADQENNLGPNGKTLDLFVVTFVIVIILLSGGFLINLAIFQKWPLQKRLLVYLALALSLGTVAETGYTVLETTASYSNSYIRHAFFRSPLRGISDIVDTQIQTGYQSNAPTIYNTASKIFIPVEAYSVVTTNGDSLVQWEINNPDQSRTVEWKTLWMIILPIEFLLWFCILLPVFEIYRRLGMRTLKF